MATIEKRVQTPGQPPKYRVRWWANDNQRSKTFVRHEDARRFKALLEGDIANGTYRDPKDATVTVAQVSERWWDSLVDIRPSTKDRVGLARKHVLAEFGSLPVSSVTHQHVTQWVASSCRSMGAASVRKNAFTLKRIMDVALHEGLVKANPVANVRLPAEPRNEQRFLTHDEVNTLLEKAPDRYRAMMMVAVYGGLRFGELCALRRENINVLRNTIHVKQTLVDLNSTLTFGPPKTRTSVRDVTLPRSVMAQLVEHMDKFTASQPDSLVFTFAKGGAIRRAWYRQRVWLPTVERAGLGGLRFHDLRHTFVAMWIDLGRNAKEVSRVAGHSSVAFTLDRYGHLYETDHDDLADQLDAMLESSGAQGVGHSRSQDVAYDVPKAPDINTAPLCSGLARRPLKAGSGLDSGESSSPAEPSNPSL